MGFYVEAKRSASIEDVQIVSGISPVDLSSGAVTRGRAASTCTASLPGTGG